MFPPDPASADSLELGSSYGVMLLSTVIVAAFYGFTVLQTVYYFEQFPKDPLMIKLTVAFIWFSDTLTIIFNCHAIYFYLIDNYNHPPALQHMIWSAPAELIVTYSVVLIVQLFFILRIYHLRPHRWYIPAFLGIVAFASYVMVIAIFITVIQNDTWATTSLPEVTRPLTANWVLGNLVDISITVALCWYLWSEKIAVKKTTSMMLNRIIVFLVNRGAIAAIVQVLTLLTKFIWPQTLVWLAFHNALSKVYVNSMLATLNARVALRRMVMESALDQERPPSEFEQASSRPVSKPLGRQMQDPHQIATLQFARNSALSTSAYDARSAGVSSRTTTTSSTMDTADYQRTPDRMNMSTGTKGMHTARTAPATGPSTSPTTHPSIAPTAVGRDALPTNHEYNSALTRQQTRGTARSEDRDDAYSYMKM